MGSTSVFIFLACIKMEKKIMGNKLRRSEGMFDIHLDWEGRVRSQMCVFVIKQVRAFHLKENTRERSDLPVQSFCFSRWRTTNNIFSQFPSAAALSLSFDNIILWGHSHFDLYYFEKWMKLLRQQVGNRLSFYELLWVYSQPVSNSAIGRQWPKFKQMPASFIRAMPHPSCQYLAKFFPD